MNRRTNLINNIILLAVTVAAIFVVTLLGNNYYSSGIVTVMLLFLVGAILMALLNTVVHEAGHIVAGKRNGFEFVSLRLVIFEFFKHGGKLKMRFTGLKDELGSTEMIPKDTENLEKRFVKMTRGGLYGTVILLVLSVLPLIFVQYLPLAVYAIFGMLLPVSLYFLFANMLPMVSEGVRNDAAVLSGIKHGDDFSKVTMNLLKIHAGLMHGQTPSEIDESLYFDLPQIAEDDPNYIILLNNRYAYYVDKGDTENAIKVSDRLFGLLDEMPKVFRDQIRADLLYNACTFDYNEKRADDMTEDAEKYLNGNNCVSNLRIKAAYLLYVIKDSAQALKFIEKAENDAAVGRIPGLVKYELKLLSALRADLPVEKAETPAE